MGSSRPALHAAACLMPCCRIKTTPPCPGLLHPSAAAARCGGAARPASRRDTALSRWSSRAAARSRCRQGLSKARAGFCTCPVHAAALCPRTRPAPARPLPVGRSASAVLPPVQASCGACGASSGSTPCLQRRPACLGSLCAAAMMMMTSPAAAPTMCAPARPCTHTAAAAAAPACLGACRTRLLLAPLRLPHRGTTLQERVADAQADWVRVQQRGRPKQEDVLEVGAGCWVLGAAAGCCLVVLPPPPASPLPQARPSTPFVSKQIGRLHGITSGKWMLMHQGDRTAEPLWAAVARAVYAEARLGGMSGSIDRRVCGHQELARESRLWLTAVTAC